MANPYESPKCPDREQKRYQSPTKSILTVVLGLGGAVIGFVIYAILSIMEGYAFYTLLSTLTGENAPYAIANHPATFWIEIGLFASFLLGGLISGLWLARVMNRRF